MSDSLPTTVNSGAKLVGFLMPLISWQEAQPRSVTNALPCATCSGVAGSRGTFAKKSESVFASMDAGNGPGRFSYYDVTRQIAVRAGRLRHEWRRQGQTLSLADATIAAVAIHHSLILLTDNRRHFPMPELSMHPLPA